MVLAACGWLGMRAFQARAQLAEARRELVAVESALRTGHLQPNDAGIRRAVAAAARSTGRARQLTSDRLWRLAARVPIAGCPLRSSAALTHTADELTRTVLQPLATLAPVMEPHRSQQGVAVDVAGLRRASGDVARMNSDLRGLTHDVVAIKGCGVVGARLGIPSARDELSGRISRLAASTTDLGKATRLLPAMLGADEPRRYLLVVQNDAESRATGGVIGGYGFLTANGGRLSLDTRNAGTLPGFGPGPVLELPADVQARYARFGLATYWGNANLTPDFPVAGRVYSAMWTRGTGQQLDGVVATDPTMLAYLLSATGTARMPDGQTVTGDGLVALLESRIYALLPTNEQRDAYFAAAGKAIYQAVLSSAASPVRLLPALGRAAGEGRLLVWSRRPAEQRILETTPLAGVLPTAPGPYLAVVTQNGTGSKLDYWLQRSTDYALRRLPGNTGEAVVTVRLSNTAPPHGLPLYVRQRLEESAPRRLTPGQSQLYVSIYGGVGSGFTSATLDRRSVRLESEVENGHGVFSTFITVNPGQTRTLRLVLAEPVWAPYVTVRPQPLVRPERLTISGAELRSVPLSTLGDRRSTKR